MSAPAVRVTRRRRAVAEPLERRQLLAFTATVVSRTLVVNADGGDQNFYLQYGLLVAGGKVTGLHSVAVSDFDDRSVLPVQFDGRAFDSIRIALGGGDDTFRSLFAFVDSSGEEVDPPSRPVDAAALPRRPITVDGGSGSDSLYGSPMPETLVGGSGDDGGDVLESGGNADSLVGSSGDDGFEVQAVDPTDIRGGVTLSEDGIVVTVVGGAGDDSIAPDRLADSDGGGTNPDVPAMRVDAGAGVDDIVGSSRADSIRGGDGNDYVSAGSGDDTIYGDAGDDVLTAGGGRNRLYGGEGKDRLNGAAGRDFLYGEAGDDRLYGQAGNDYLDGGGNVDRIYAGDGDDNLIGGSAIDRLYGEDGNDSFVGGAGNDYLFGGAGNDVNRSVDAGDVVDSVESVA